VEEDRRKCARAQKAKGDPRGRRTATQGGLISTSVDHCKLCLHSRSPPDRTVPRSRRQVRERLLERCKCCLNFVSALRTDREVPCTSSLVSAIADEIKIGRTRQPPPPPPPNCANARSSWRSVRTDARVHGDAADEAEGTKTKRALGTKAHQRAPCKARSTATSGALTVNTLCPETCRDMHRGKNAERLIRYRRSASEGAMPNPSPLG